MLDNITILLWGLGSIFVMLSMFILASKYKMDMKTIGYRRRKARVISLKTRKDTVACNPVCIYKVGDKFITAASANVFTRSSCNFLIGRSVVIYYNEDDVTDFYVDLSNREKQLMNAHYRCINTGLFIMLLGTICYIISVL